MSPRMFGYQKLLRCFTFCWLPRGRGVVRLVRRSVDFLGRWFGRRQWLSSIGMWVTLLRACSLRRLPTCFCLLGSTVPLWSLGLLLSSWWGFPGRASNLPGITGYCLLAVSSLVLFLRWLGLSVRIGRLLPLLARRDIHVRGLLGMISVLELWSVLLMLRRPSIRCLVLLSACWLCPD